MKKIDGINMGKKSGKGWSKKNLIIPWVGENDEKKLKKLMSKLHKSVYSWLNSKNILKKVDGKKVFLNIKKGE